MKYHALVLLCLLGAAFQEGPSEDSVLEEESLVERINNQHHSTPPDWRIVNGDKVPRGKRLFQVALFRRGRFTCGGSLLSRRFLLTAAHCVRNVEPKDIQVRFGTRNYKHGPLVAINRIHVHPLYRPYSVHHDIAILRLALPVSRIRNRVDYVQLNLNQDPSTDSVVQVSGWGRTGRLQSVSEKLLMTNLRVTNHSVCQGQWGSVFSVQSGMICASDLQSSACHGDSGGPLTLGPNIQVGVVSIGSPSCFSHSRPNVYTSVFHYRDWIQKILQTDW